MHDLAAVYLDHVLDHLRAFTDPNNLRLRSGHPIKGPGQNGPVSTPRSEAGLTGTIGIENNLAETTDTRMETIRLPIQLRRRGVEARLVLTDAQPPASNADPNLIRLLGQANFLASQLTSGKAVSITDLANATGSNAAEISRILPLAFLAPELVRQILEGRQPPELTSEALKRIDTLPVLWRDQRAHLGFAA